MGDRRKAAPRIPESLRPDTTPARGHAREVAIGSFCACAIGLAGAPRLSCRTVSDTFGLEPNGNPFGAFTRHACTTAHGPGTDANRKLQGKVSPIYTVISRQDSISKTVSYE